MDLLIYHGGDCNDGFCCAMLAASVWPGIQLHAGRYGDPPPDVKGKRVLVADFSYPRNVMLKMKEEALELVVLDHHKTAQANCEGLDFCHFNMDQCGASLLNDWLYATNSRFYRMPYPRFISYIRDRDLWLKQLEDNDAFHAWVSAHPKQIPVWEQMAQAFEADPEECLSAGKLLLMALRREVELTAAKSWMQVIGGVLVPVVNNTNRSITSDLLHKMSINQPFAASFWKEGNRTVWSLRSQEGETDVSEIARKYGGGGHKHAAGFTTP